MQLIFRIKQAYFNLIFTFHFYNNSSEIWRRVFENAKFESSYINIIKFSFSFQRYVGYDVAHMSNRQCRKISTIKNKIIKYKKNSKSMFVNVQQLAFVNIYTIKYCYQLMRLVLTLTQSLRRNQVLVHVPLSWKLGFLAFFYYWCALSKERVYWGSRLLRQSLFSKYGLV